MMKRNGAPRKLLRYGVQAFRASHTGRCEAEKPRLVDSADQARRLGVRLAAEKAGVVVFEQAIDPIFGDHEPAVVLEVFGDLPADLDQLLP